MKPAMMSLNSMEAVRLWVRKGYGWRVYACSYNGARHVAFTSCALRRQVFARPVYFCATYRFYV